MCKGLLNTINTIVTIIAFVYLFKIYNDTKIDVFQKNIEIGEKENYFIDPAQNPNQLLKYEPKCQAYEKMIMNPTTQKLGDVFKINMETINGRIYFILIVNILIIAFFLFIILEGILLIILPGISACLAIVLLALSIALYVGLILSNIIFIVLIYSYYSSDTNAYNDFLTCKNVNYDGFSKYRVIEKFKYDFKRFMIFNIVSMLLSFILNRDNKNRE